MGHAAAQLERDRAYFAADLQTPRTFSGHPIETQPDGTAIIKGVEIFKAGTFRDSMGEQNTWTDIHLQQMAMHFELLRDRGIFPDVPVRRDHSYTIDKVMGYFEKVYVQGDKLVADYHVTEPDAIDKLARGTFRSRSLEVGMYTTNDETSYWPVVFGVAYVDIPAVEGLHSKSAPVNFFASNTSKETPVTTQNDDRGAQRPSAFRINGQDTTDHAAVQAYIAQLEARPVGNFRVKGTETSDFAAVQAHIDAMEAFQNETRDAGRKAFVTGLAKANKIVEPMVESFTKLAVGMTDEQFEAFKASYELAPENSLLANHGGGSNESKDPANRDAKASQDEIDRETLRMHAQAGVLTEEQIKNTKAYKRLHADKTA